jgi:hypothetical protein
MKDRKIASLLGREWSHPKEKNSEIVRCMLSNKGKLTFRFKEGDVPTRLRVRFLSFFREEPPVHQFGIWWNDTLLLETSDLKRNALNTIVTTIPKQSGEKEFHVLRFTCAEDVRSAGYEPLDESRHLYLAFIELELH